MKVISIDADFEECIPHVEIVNEHSEVVGVAYGERTARLFSVAEEAYGLLKKFLECRRIDRAKVQELVDRVEQDSELTFCGLTMQELLDEVINPPLSGRG